jgi:hypothetical protein
MPNPFPGMNPYLEERSEWQGCHNSLMVRISDALNAVLPPEYVASTEVRCVIAHSARVIEPDVAVREQISVALPRCTGGTAILDLPKTATIVAPDSFDLPLVVTVDTWEERQAFVNIVRVGKGKFRDAEVVTTIEILSPTSKNTWDDGYKAYRSKQEQVLSSRASLLEIDLRRTGTYAIAVPQAVLPIDRVWHYIACLHRGSRPPEYAVWLNSLHEPLPRVEVPLAEGDPSVVLDLQAVFNLSYDAGAYDRLVDYAQEADPPLQGDDALWADALLRERGLRP